MEISSHISGDKCIEHDLGVRPRSGFCQTGLKLASFREAWLTPAHLYQIELATPSTHSFYLPSWASVHTVPLPLPHVLLLFSSRRSLLILQFSPADCNRQLSFNITKLPFHQEALTSMERHFLLRSLFLVHGAPSYNLLSLVEEEQWPFSI